MTQKIWDRRFCRHEHTHSDKGVEYCDDCGNWVPSIGQKVLVIMGTNTDWRATIKDIRPYGQIQIDFGKNYLDWYTADDYRVRPDVGEPSH